MNSDKTSPFKVRTYIAKNNYYLSVCAVRIGRERLFVLTVPLKSYLAIFSSVHVPAVQLQFTMKSVQHPPFYFVVTVTRAKTANQ